MAEYRSVVADLIDRAPGGVAIMTPDTLILYANQACASLTRNSRTLSATLHQSDVSPLQFAITRLKIAPSAVQRVELRFLDASGSDVWMLAELSAATLDSHGGLGDVLVQMTDIDRQKRTEADMPRRADEMHGQHRARPGSKHHRQPVRHRRGGPHHQAPPRP